MKRIFIACFMILVLLLVWFLLRFVAGGDEDTWICSEGKWIMHGKPSGYMPQTPCR